VPPLRLKQEEEQRAQEALLEEQRQYDRALLLSQEEEERAIRARVLAEQDRAYQQSLEDDRAKEEVRIREEQHARDLIEKERAEHAAHEREQEQRELLDAIQLSQTLTEGAQRERKLRELVHTLPPEPAATDQDALRLLVQLPSGSKIERFFRSSDTFGDVRTFVETRALEEWGGLEVPTRFVLVTDYPRKVWGDMQAKLSEAEFRKRALLRVEQII